MSSWIYPYPRLFGDVELRVEGLRVDGVEVPGQQIDTDHREVRLVDLERATWQHAEIEITISGPQTELAGLDGRPSAVAVADCPSSNSRLGVKLTSGPGDPSTWAGRVELDRDLWFGRIDLTGVVVREVDGVTDRVIGEADPWTIRLDDVPSPPVHGAIEILWHNFREPDEQLKWLQRYEGEAAYLRLEEERPTLFLNRAFEGLKALLDRNPGREAGEQALHDQTRATLAIEAWSAMFGASLQAIQVEEQGGEADWPETPWQRTALELALERIYPEKTLEDSLQEVADHLRDPEAAGMLQERLLTAVSAHVGGPRLLRGAIKQLGANLKEVA
jgi:hypothetical protein